MKHGSELLRAAPIRHVDSPSAALAASPDLTWHPGDLISNPYLRIRAYRYDISYFVMRGLRPVSLPDG